jgi:hypothetical protein
VKRTKALVIAPNQSPFIEALRGDLMKAGIGVDFRIHGEEAPPSSCDLLLLVIHADRGISQLEIERFNTLREKQIPALILVASLMPEDGLPLSEDRWDFDDVVMLISRTLEKAVTPYLVLHDDAGVPIGLYDLEGDEVIDHSSGVGERSRADVELREVVQDFKEEFEDDDFSITDFSSGLRVVALPYLPERGIGSKEISTFLTTLQPTQT